MVMRYDEVLNYESNQLIAAKLQIHTFVQAGKGGELTRDETTIIAGALELSGKTAMDSMTPISETFAININAKLDR